MEATHKAHTANVVKPDRKPLPKIHRTSPTGESGRKPVNRSTDLWSLVVVVNVKVALGDVVQDNSQVDVSDGERKRRKDRDGRSGLTYWESPSPLRGSQK